MGGADTRKSVRMHFHYALFAEILQDLAKTVAAMPPSDAAHRDMLRDAAKALYRALDPARNDKADLARHDARRRGPAAACHGVVADKSTASGSPPLRQGGDLSLEAEDVGDDIGLLVGLEHDIRHRAM